MQGSDWEKGVKGVKGQSSGSRRSTEVEIYPEMCITSKGIIIKIGLDDKTKC